MKRKTADLIKIIATGLLIGFSSISGANGVDGDAAFKNQLPSLIDDIKTANAYSWGVVGTPSDQSRAEKAIRILFKNASDDVLVEASNTSTLEGKMYVLCLLKKKNSDAYEKVKSSIDAKNSQVTVFSGSVLSKASAEVVIGQIERFSCDHLR